MVIGGALAETEVLVKFRIYKYGLRLVLCHFLELL